MSQSTIENLPAAQSSGTMTYEQFLSWDAENQHVEWVKGRVVPMPPISDAHQDVTGLLSAAMRAFVEVNRLGRVFCDPFQMKTGVDLPGRAPDIMFVATSHLKRLKKNHLQGPGDLVVEIVSPGSRGTDRGDKFYEYEKGGVPEYWLIDPERKQAEFFLRGQDGIYKPAALDPDGIYHSKQLPGLWIKPDWFWKKPRPLTLDVLRHWKLI